MSRLGMLESFGQGLRRGAAGFIDAINPIRTFASQQRRKLAAEVAGSYKPMSRIVGMYDRKALRGSVAKGLPIGQRLQSYFNGYNMDDMVPSNMTGASRMSKGVNSLYGQVAAKRAGVRRMTAGVLGAATLGTMVFGRDNLVSEGGISGTTMGLTGLAAAGIAGLGPRGVSTSAATGIRTGITNPFAAAGAAGLIGYTALNMYRGGDQWGPF